MDCAFCSDPEVRERVIWENDHAFAFPTLMPIVPGHILIAPKRHAQYLEELSLEEREALERLRIALKGALARVFGAKGFNYAWNEEKIGGQSVPHLHVHVVPRREGDSGVHGYEPRSFLYRPGSREESAAGELRAVAAAIRAAL